MYPESDYPQPEGEMLPVFDRAFLDDVTGGDPSINEAFINKVLGLLPEYVDDLVGQLQKGDLETARAMAHRLKSVSASVGGKRMSAAMASLETACGEKTVGEPEEASRAIRAEAARLQQALEAAQDT